MGGEVKEPRDITGVYESGNLNNQTPFPRILFYRISYTLINVVDFCKDICKTLCNFILSMTTGESERLPSVYILVLLPKVSWFTRNSFRLYSIPCLFFFPFSRNRLNNTYSKPAFFKRVEVWFSYHQ